MPAPQSAEPPPPPARKRDAVETAPADATAFAPKKLRRGTPELVRIVIHQPKDLQAVIKAARKIDPRTDAAPSGMKVGEVALGAKVGVSLEVRGAICDGAVQRRVWQGEPLDFNFSVEAEEDVKQAVVLARVFIDDAQIGVLAFTRGVSGPKKAPASGDRIRLKRHKRVFLSYSSKDRETVSAIATAYEAAGVQHFFDRTSLKSGEEWSPRLRKEIDKRRSLPSVLVEIGGGVRMGDHGSRARADAPPPFQRQTAGHHGADARWSALGKTPDEPRQHQFR
jgi:hypothetical protein